MSSVPSPVPAPHPVSSVLITAGPTHEPIDAVRFLGNRSSGRLGIELARACSARALSTRLLLGPVGHDPELPGVELIRFRTTEDLHALLREHAPQADLVIMAAAVSDYRPKRTVQNAPQKLTRDEAGLTLELESTPDLLAELGRNRHPGQTLVGFALEPADRLLSSARAKLERKGVDYLVANPLETMDSGHIDATLLSRFSDATDSTDAPISKEAFASWLLDRVLDQT